MISDFEEFEKKYNEQIEELVRAKGGYIENLEDYIIQKCKKCNTFYKFENETMVLAKDYSGGCIEIDVQDFNHVCIVCLFRANMSCKNSKVSE